ncbi:Bromodomain-containing protein [Whalleya microplaca]|nr:Bromodomain-containing protein [Whalleya microplaca]
MDNKRKASGVNGVEAASDTPDRAAKRRKLQEEFGDLSNGETSESTTAYGLNILESIRATTDKNGRPVSPFFERIPSRSENADYYKVIRLPLSLELIERKLKNRQYSTLSTLESDFKRLVSNAKETNERSSVAFGDAERVRKAVSNLMVKFNPAYKSGNYQAVATPLPPTPDPNDDNDDDGEGEEDAEGEEDVDVPAAPEAPADAEAEDEAEDEDAQGEDEEQIEDDEEDEDDNDDDDDDDDDGDSRRTGRRRRRGPGRPPKNPVAHARKVAARGPTPGKLDAHYENTPYKGLNFQQAQEKIVEDLIRKKDEGDDYPYFEPFIFLPPRTLKDYYEIIAEPLSLKALQKQVRGQHGRSEATYVSDFKGWAAFEDQASLIWKNAYHYNEDGSEISLMAQELEQQFYEYLNEAKQHVPEPPQPKIKLKVSQNPETPAHPKKITIHVGGKASAAGSPAPATGQSVEGDATRNGTPVGRNPFGANPTANPINLSQLEKARSMSASAGPPSPSAAGLAKQEEVARPSPVIAPQPPATTYQQFAPMVIHPSGPMPNGGPPPPPPAPKRTTVDILDAQKYRPRPIKESEALLPKLVIASHPTLQLDSRMSITIPASPTEAQQELVFNCPGGLYRLHIKPQIAAFLELQQREWKLNVLHDSMRLFPPQYSYEKRNEPTFEANLHFGINRLDVSVVAALPKGQVAPNGLAVELERFVVHFNLLRHQ